MNRVLQFLAAGYSRQLIGKVTDYTMLASVPVVVFARWDVLSGMVQP